MVTVREIDIVNAGNNGKSLEELIIKNFENSCLEDINKALTVMLKQSDQNKARLIGAFDEGKLIGLTYFYPAGFRDDKTRLFIGNIFTVSECSFELTAGLLLDYAEQFALANSFHSVFLHTEAGDTVYRQLAETRGYEKERIQIAKKTIKHQEHKLTEIHTLTGKYLTENLDSFSDLFYANLKAHVLTDSFDYQFAYSKMAGLSDFLDEGRAAAFYAEENTVPVGFVWVYHNPADTDEKMLINAIQVNEKFRGRKLGEKLLNAVENKIVDAGYTILYTHTDAANTGAVRFYHKYGFIDENYQYVKRIDNKNRSNRDE